MLNYLIPLIYIFLFLFLVKKKKWFNLGLIPWNWVAGAFLLKILAGIALTLLYQYYPPYQETGDSFKYFNDSGPIYNALFTHPSAFFRMMTGIGDGGDFIQRQYDEMSAWFRVYDNGLFNDSHTMIRFNALLRLVSFGHYSVHLVIINIISFTGLVALFKFITRYVKGKEWPLFLAVFFIPSVLFWGSGVSKEALSIGITGFFLYNLDSVMRRTRLKIGDLLWIFFLSCLMTLIKTYVFVLLIPCLVAFYWDSGTTKIKTGLKYLIVIVAFALIFFNFHLIFAQYNLPEILSNKQKEFSRFAETLHPGQREWISMHLDSFAGWMLSLPLAFVKTLIYPFSLNLHSLPTFFSAFENLMIVICLFLPFFKHEKDLPSRNFLYFAMIFVVMNFVLIGLTTPLAGAIHRYRVVALPLFMVIVVLQTNFEEKRNSH